MLLKVPFTSIRFSGVFQNCQFITLTNAEKNKYKIGLNILLGKYDTEERMHLRPKREALRPFSPLPMLSQACSQRATGRLCRNAKKETLVPCGSFFQHASLVQLRQQNLISCSNQDPFPPVSSVILQLVYDICFLLMVSSVKVQMASCLLNC